jgi:hypothetical protein
MKKVISASSYNSVKKAYTEMLSNFLQQNTTFTLEHSETTPSQKLHAVTLTESETLEILRYIQDDNNIIMGSPVPPAPLLKLPSKFDTAALSRTASQEDANEVYDEIVTSLGMTHLKTTKVPTFSPSGYQAKIAATFHIDLDDINFQPNSHFYICTITEDPRITTPCIITPCPVFNFQIEGLADLADRITSRVEFDCMDTIEDSLLKHIHNLSHKAIQILLNQNILEQEQLAPNTLYRIDKTVHISPPLIEDAGPRLHLVLLTQPRVS